MGLVLLRRRRVRLVLMAGALNKGDEGRVLLHAILNPRSHRVGSKGKDLQPGPDVAPIKVIF
jgi:hypothetical protein